jgi:hypothetical protein
MAMAFKETDLEKKTLSEIEALIFGCEQKSKEIALKVGTGHAKPTDMLAVNSDLAMLRKVHEKKMMKEKRLVHSEQPKAAAPLKSYEDFVSSHHDKKH